MNDLDIAFAEVVENKLHIARLSKNLLSISKEVMDNRKRIADLESELKKMQDYSEQTRRLVNDVK